MTAPRTLAAISAEAEKLLRGAARDRAPVDAGRVARLHRLIREASKLATDNEMALARAVLEMADVADMPDSYWASDSCVKLARDTLGVPADGRYTHARLWEQT